MVKMVAIKVVDPKYENQIHRPKHPSSAKQDDRPWSFLDPNEIQFTLSEDSDLQSILEETQKSPPEQLLKTLINMFIHKLQVEISNLTIQLKVPVPEKIDLDNSSNEKGARKEYIVLTFSCKELKLKSTSDSMSLDSSIGDANDGISSNNLAFTKTTDICGLEVEWHHRAEKKNDPSQYETVKLGTLLSVPSTVSFSLNSQSNHRDQVWKTSFCIDVLSNFVLCASPQSSEMLITVQSVVSNLFGTRDTLIRAQQEEQEDKEGEDDTDFDEDGQQFLDAVDEVWDSLLGDDSTVQNVIESSPSTWTLCARTRHDIKGTFLWTWNHPTATTMLHNPTKMQNSFFQLSISAIDFTRSHDGTIQAQTGIVEASEFYFTGKGTLSDISDNNMEPHSNSSNKSLDPKQKLQWPEGFIPEIAGDDHVYFPLLKIYSISTTAIPPSILSFSIPDYSPLNINDSVPVQSSPEISQPMSSQDALKSLRMEDLMNPSSSLPKEEGEGQTQATKPASLSIRKDGDGLHLAWDCLLINLPSTYKTGMLDMLIQDINKLHQLAYFQSGISNLAHASTSHSPPSQSNWLDSAAISLEKKICNFSGNKLTVFVRKAHRQFKTFMPGLIPPIVTRDFVSLHIDEIFGGEFRSHEYPNLKHLSKQQLLACPPRPTGTMTVNFKQMSAHHHTLRTPIPSSHCNDGYPPIIKTSYECIENEEDLQLHDDVLSVAVAQGCSIELRFNNVGEQFEDYPPLSDLDSTDKPPFANLDSSFQSSSPRIPPIYKQYLHLDPNFFVSHPTSNPTPLNYRSDTYNRYKSDVFLTSKISLTLSVSRLIFQLHKHQIDDILKITNPALDPLPGEAIRCGNGLSNFACNLVVRSIEPSILLPEIPQFDEDKDEEEKFDSDQKKPVRSEPSKIEKLIECIFSNDNSIASLPAHRISHAQNLEVFIVNNIYQHLQNVCVVTIQEIELDHLPTESLEFLGGRQLTFENSHRYYSKTKPFTFDSSDPMPLISIYKPVQQSPNQKNLLLKEQYPMLHVVYTDQKFPSSYEEMQKYGDASKKRCLVQFYNSQFGISALDDPFLRDLTNYFIARPQKLLSSTRNSKSNGSIMNDQQLIVWTSILDCALVCGPSLTFHQCSTLANSTKNELEAIQELFLGVGNTEANVKAEMAAKIEMLRSIFEAQEQASSENGGFYTHYNYRLAVHLPFVEITTNMNRNLATHDFKFRGGEHLPLNSASASPQFGSIPVLSRIPLYFYTPIIQDMPPRRLDAFGDELVDVDLVAHRVHWMLNHSFAPIGHIEISDYSKSNHRLSTHDEDDDAEGKSMLQEFESASSWSSTAPTTPNIQLSMRSDFQSISAVIQGIHPQLTVTGDQMAGILNWWKLVSTPIPSKLRYNQQNEFIQECDEYDNDDESEEEPLIAASIPVASSVAPPGIRIDHPAPPNSMTHKGLAAGDHPLNPNGDDDDDDEEEPLGIVSFTKIKASPKLSKRTKGLTGDSSNVNEKIPFDPSNVPSKSAMKSPFPAALPSSNQQPIPSSSSLNHNRNHEYHDKVVRFNLPDEIGKQLMPSEEKFAFELLQKASIPKPQNTYMKAFDISSDEYPDINFKYAGDFTIRIREGTGFPFDIVDSMGSPESLQCKRMSFNFHKIKFSFKSFSNEFARRAIARDPRDWNGRMLEIQAHVLRASVASIITHYANSDQQNVETTTLLAPIRTPRKSNGQGSSESPSHGFMKAGFSVEYKSVILDKNHPLNSNSEEQKEFQAFMDDNDGVKNPNTNLRLSYLYCTSSSSLLDLQVNIPLLTLLNRCKFKFESAQKIYIPMEIQNEIFQIFTCRKLKRQLLNCDHNIVETRIRPPVIRLTTQFVTNAMLDHKKLRMTLRNAPSWQFVAERVADVYKDQLVSSDTFATIGSRLPVISILHAVGQSVVEVAKASNSSNSLASAAAQGAVDTASEIGILITQLIGGGGGVVASIQRGWLQEEDLGTPPQRNPQNLRQGFEDAGRTIVRNLKVVASQFQQQQSTDSNFTYLKNTAKAVGVLILYPLVALGAVANSIKKGLLAQQSRTVPDDDATMAVRDPFVTQVRR